MKKHKIYCIIQTICFVLTGLFFVSFCLTDLAASLKMKNIILVIGWTGDALIGGLLYWLMKTKKIPRFAVGIASVLMMAVFMFGFIADTSQAGKYEMNGNNSYAGTYTLPAWGKPGNENLQEAIDKALSDMERDGMEYQEFYRLERADAVWVYFKAENSVIRLEFAIENDRYYQVGITHSIYHGFVEKSCSDEDTIKADIAYSVFNERFAFDNVPIWGISQNERVKDMKINSAGVDYVEQIYDTDGGIYYFWLIEDGSIVQDSKDLENVTIEGLE